MYENLTKLASELDSTDECDGWAVDDDSAEAREDPIGLSYMSYGKMM